MLIIRQEQLHLLEAAWLEKLEDTLHRELPETFPWDSARLGAERLRHAISHGIDKARSYGFRTEHHIRDFIRLMFTFGRDFETDPGMPWATRILHANRTPASKLAALLAATPASASTTSATSGYFAQTELVHGVQHFWDCEW